MTPSQTRAARNELNAAYAGLMNEAGAIAVTVRPFRRREQNFQPRASAKAIFQRIDEKHLGRRYFEWDASFRVRGVLIAEGIKADMHLHGVVLPPKSYKRPFRRENFTEHTNQTLQRLYPQGDVDVRDIFDPIGWIQYCTKETCITDGILAQEFWPTK